jgi:hypothetical protein
VVSSTAVGLLGPLVKSAGFAQSLVMLAALSTLTLLAIWALPSNLESARVSRGT